MTDRAVRSVRAQHPVIRAGQVPFVDLGSAWSAGDGLVGSSMFHVKHSGGAGPRDESWRFVLSLLRRCDPAAPDRSDPVQELIIVRAGSRGDLVDSPVGLLVRSLVGSFDQLAGLGTAPARSSGTESGR